MTTRSQSIIDVLSMEHTDIFHVSLEARIRLIPFATSGISSMNELPRFFPPATEKKGKKKVNSAFCLNSSSFINKIDWEVKIDTETVALCDKEISQLLRVNTNHGRLAPSRRDNSRLRRAGCHWKCIRKTIKNWILG